MKISIKTQKARIWKNPGVWGGYFFQPLVTGVGIFTGNLTPPGDGYLHGKRFQRRIIQCNACNVDPTVKKWQPNAWKTEKLRKLSVESRKEDGDIFVMGSAALFFATKCWNLNIDMQHTLFYLIAGVSVFVEKVPRKMAIFSDKVK